MLAVSHLLVGVRECPEGNLYGYVLNINILDASRLGRFLDNNGFPPLTSRSSCSFITNMIDWAFAKCHVVLRKFYVWMWIRGLCVYTCGYP